MNDRDIYRFANSGCTLNGYSFIAPKPRQYRVQAKLMVSIKKQEGAVSHPNP